MINKHDLLDMTGHGISLNLFLFEQEHIGLENHPNLEFKMADDGDSTPACGKVFHR